MGFTWAEMGGGMIRTRCVESSSYCNLGGEPLGVFGRTAYQCPGVSVTEALCGFIGNCEGHDAASIAVSIVQTCGVNVLRFGIK